MDSTPTPTNPSDIEFPTGNGEMAALVRAFDWSRTALGPIALWPQSLRTAIDLMLASPLPMAILWGADGIMIYNDAYCTVAGKRHPASLGSKVEVSWPEVADYNRGVLDKVLAGETLALADQNIVFYRNGVPEDCWMDLSYVPVRDDSGRPVAALATVIETTERRVTEQQLKFSEDQFRMLAEAIPNHAWAAGPDGLLNWFNRRVYEYTGAEPGELDGEKWAMVVHPEDLARAGPAWARSIADGTPYEVEFRLRRDDGLYRWFLARALPVCDANGAITRWIGTNTDITKQREIEDAQRALNHTLEERVAERTADRDRMWRLSQDLMMVVNDADEVTIGAVNPAWHRMLGWTEAELVGKSAIDFVHPDDMKLAAVQRPYTEDIASDGRAVRRYENRYRHKDGGWRWISWTVVAVDGILQGVGRDITQEKEQAEALAQAEAQLRQAQKMEAVGQLTGGIAHDFNNMLAIVIGSLGLLKRRLAKGETNVERFADSALEGANRAASLTHRLLAFSRQQPLKPEAIEAGRLVSGLSEMLTRTLGETIRIETVQGAGLWRAHADPHQLESAILNLAVNARDAMPDGGKLTIETANTYLDERYAGQYPGVAPGQYVMIGVTDTGGGMPEDIAAKAFDPFFTTKDVGKGTGLGLSQVYGFVRQSGGHVKIYSEVGHGTSVKLYLPRFVGEGVLAEGSAARPVAYADEAITILIVEDEAAVRQLGVEALIELGYRVLEADGAATALRLLDAHDEIDLLFTDVIMPEVNGRKLAEEARRRRPGLKILFTTGYTRNAVVHNGVLDPGVELLGKPFTIEQLGAKLRTVLDV